MQRCKRPSFSSENTARRGLERDNGRWPFFYTKDTKLYGPQTKYTQRLTQQAVRIFIRSAFPWAMRMGKVYRRIQAACDGFMVGEFGRCLILGDLL